MVRNNVVQVPKTKTPSARLARLCVALVALLPAASASAFSDPNNYGLPTSEGGGGGRFFTGSRADGYACDVCHSGAEGPDVVVSGLPLDGYVPGATYEVTLRWGLATPNVSLLTEFTDELNLGAGTIGPPAEFTPEEFCAEEGVSTGILALQAVALDDLAAEGAPPTGRMIVAVPECGARLVRYQWTAPAVATGTLWFTAGAVSSDEAADAEGDGVTVLRYPLVPAGAAPYQDAIAEGCSVGVVGRVHGWSGGAWLAPLGLLFLRRGRLRRLRTRTS